MLSGTACFFVRDYTYYYGRGRCFNDTGRIHSSGSWGNLSFLELSYNSCLEPTAQFRFRDNGAMLNLKRQGCVSGDYEAAHGYNGDMFFVYVDSVSLDNVACAQNSSKGIYRAINQNTWGGLSVYYKRKYSSSFQNWCARRQYNYLERNYYIELRTSCYYTYNDRKFFFGKFLNIFI